MFFKSLSFLFFLLALHTVSGQSTSVTCFFILFLFSAATSPLLNVGLFYWSPASTYDLKIKISLVSWYESTQAAFSKKVTTTIAFKESTILHISYSLKMLRSSKRPLVRPPLVEARQVEAAREVMLLTMCLAEVTFARGLVKTAGPKNEKLNEAPHPTPPR